MTKPIYLVDLDDNLFQTQRKLNHQNTLAYKAAAFDREQKPRSFFNKKQSNFMDWLLSTSTVIPVTARGTEETARVDIPFQSWKIMTHGAVITQPNGNVDPAWQSHIKKKLFYYQDKILTQQQRLSEAFEKNNIKAWARINYEYDGLAIYVVAKHTDSEQIDELYRIAKEVDDKFGTDGFYVHKNSNNIAWIPNDINKGIATAYLLEKLNTQEKGIPVLGLGDSLSDHSFLKLCDWFGMPNQSQLAKYFTQKDTTTPNKTLFSGSYSPSDIEFLLQPIEMKMTSIEQKETLIQSGKMHYSDMLSQEPAPSKEHLDIFKKALEIGADRLAMEVLILAKQLIHQYTGKAIVLASLVRAGVPLGVMLHRALKQLGHESYHYGISIIRDRGIDPVALSKIESKHGVDSIVFVDGWTGKGAITKQLTTSLNERNGYPSKPRLVVLADPCGMAWLSASYEDWLIPFGILGAPISGLVSRSVWSATEYHGCVICNHLVDFDHSVSLVDKIQKQQQNTTLKQIPPAICTQKASAALMTLSQKVIKKLQIKYDINNVNRIKPGIAEATRAVLRRIPDHVLVRDKQDPDVNLLILLAQSKGIIVEEVGDDLGQYRAATIIKKVL